MKTKVHTTLTFAEILEDRLAKEHMNKSEFAHALGVNKTTVSNWCSGCRQPNIDMVIRICMLLNLDMYYAIGATMTEGELHASETKLLLHYRRMNEQQKEALLHVAAVMDEGGTNK